MMKTHASKKSRKEAARSGPVRKTSRKSRGPIGPTARGVPLDHDGLVAIERAVAELRMSKARLAETFGIAPVTLQRKARATAPKTQTRLLEGLEIIRRVSEWAGGPVQAMAWYRAEPIPAFGERTAEALVKDGKAAAVRDYLDRVALGGFV